MSSLVVATNFAQTTVSKQELSQKESNQPNLSQNLKEPSGILPLPSANLGPGVNFGGILEAPAEGDWGYVLEPKLFDRVKESGFQHIRLPVSWTHYTGTNAPYQVDQAILNRVDWALAQAFSRGLKIVLDVHHYDEIHDDVLGESPRALAMWQQIAEHFSEYSNDSLYFEILNEPHGQFNEVPELWNTYLREALDVIRQSNPERKVLVGPVLWNSIEALDTFDPPLDPNLIATVQNYEPFGFSHQGAFWINPVPPIGIPWYSTLRAIQPGWANWSWETNTERSADGIQVQFQSAYAGFYLHTDQPVQDAKVLVFTADQQLQLDIGIKDSNFNGPNVSITTNPGYGRYRIDLAAVGAPNEISEILFQNTGDENSPAWNLKHLVLRGSNGVVQPIQTERFAARTWMDKAADWALQRNLPLYLGEFGTHDEGEMFDRVAWTRTVRVFAEQRNIDWAYWAFSGSMGFYEPEPDEFNSLLLRALIPPQ